MQSIKLSKIRVFSNAERAGLKERDFLISINGKEVVLMMKIMMFLVKLIITNSSSRCLTWTTKMSVAWLRRLGLEWILKLRGSFQIQHHHRTISVSFLNRTSGKESIWISQSCWAGSTTPPSTFYHRHHYHHHYHHHQMDLNNMGCCKNKSSSPSSFSALEWI